MEIDGDEKTQEVKGNITPKMTTLSQETQATQRSMCKPPRPTMARWITLADGGLEFGFRKRENPNFQAQRRAGVPVGPEPFSSSSSFVDVDSNSKIHTHQHTRLQLAPQFSIDLLQLRVNLRRIAKWGNQCPNALRTDETKLKQKTSMNVREAAEKTTRSWSSCSSVKGGGFVAGNGNVGGEEGGGGGRQNAGVSSCRTGKDRGKVLVLRDVGAGSSEPHIVAGTWSRSNPVVG
ncbi:hypothetical protein GALMADRAFT_147650 [Galerina marginata CBS 339.88]|uniref:Uncharacterized protein n=1 Tax=Galerina marginata (strain CBS 339.88) TaxID=685588 RepID=A0A067SGB2_GALM3|nr:hypothetical protein GALMADRAFT_147650 [Galerina marginata CBS 339.88]